MTAAASSSGAQPASRTLVVAGFILATLFSGVVTFCVGAYSADYQARRAEKTIQVNHFVETAQAFDPLVVKFVAETRDKKLSAQTRRSIKDNLVQQRSALENTQALLTSDKQAQALAESYSKMLTAADDGLKSAKDPLDSRDFVQAAVHIAELRPKLYTALRD